MIKPVIQIIAADTPATVIPASRSDILSVLFQYIEISVQIGLEVVISIFGCVKWANGSSVIEILDGFAIDYNKSLVSRMDSESTRVRIYFPYPSGRCIKSIDFPARADQQ